MDSQVGFAPATPQSSQWPIHFYSHIAPASPIATVQDLEGTREMRKDAQPGNRIHLGEPDLAVINKIRRLESGLSIKAGQENIRRKGAWSNDETEVLIAYFQDGEHYQKLKTHSARTWDKLERNVFCGTRTAKGIEARWGTLKDGFQKADQRVKSTGEGAKDAEQWISMKKNWLNARCPYYHELSDILMKDKSVNPPMASEVGRGKPRVIIGVDSDEEDSLPYAGWSDEDSDNHFDDDHPSDGGKKLPEKGKERNTLPSKKGIKIESVSKADAALKQIAKEKLEHERAVFEYTKKRDREDREVQREVKQMQHEQRMVQLRMMEQKLKIQGQQQELELTKMRLLLKRAHQEAKLE